MHKRCMYEIQQVSVSLSKKSLTLEHMFKYKDFDSTQLIQTSIGLTKAILWSV